MIDKNNNFATLVSSIFIVMVLVSAFTTQAAVWKDVNTWDDDWENKYQLWVKNSWTEDFFMNEKKPTYYLFSHDCADAVYAMRLIFSYENKLPFIIHNPSKRGKYLSNRKGSWNKLPKEKRIRKFLDYVANVTSTRSLAKDTFPIALDDIKPGDLYAAPDVHSYQVVNITEEGVAEVMSSTTPKAPRFLDRIPSFPFYVPEDIKKERDGYRRFIQPQNIKKSIKKQPGYNNEQYKIAEMVKHDYVRFTDIIASALGKKEEKADAKTLRLLIAMCMYANDRSVYIYEALYKLQEMKKKGRRCMTRGEYNNYSTPSRDRRLKAFFNAVKNHYERNEKYKHWTQPQRWAKALFSAAPPRDRE